MTASKLPLTDLADFNTTALTDNHIDPWPDVHPILGEAVMPATLVARIETESEDVEGRFVLVMLLREGGFEMKKSSQVDKTRRAVLALPERAAIVAVETTEKIKVGVLRGKESPNPS